MDTNKCLILIVIIVLILLLIQRVMFNKKVIDEFQSGILSTSSEQIKINSIINNILKRKMETVKLVPSTKDNAINLLDDESPLGMISFFYQNPNRQEEEIWVECNGQVIDIADYPDFFNYLNTGKPESEQVISFTVPNIIGRTIVGAGLVNSSDPQHKNTKTIYGSTNKIAFHSFTQNTFDVGERGGVDSCPDNMIIGTKGCSGFSGDINVCSNMSNMPPHIYFMPFMKVKNRKFILSYKV